MHSPTFLCTRVHNSCHIVYEANGASRVIIPVVVRPYQGNDDICIRYPYGHTTDRSVPYPATIN